MQFKKVDSPKNIHSKKIGLLQVVNRGIDETTTVLNLLVSIVHCSSH